MQLFCHLRHLIYIREGELAARAAAAGNGGVMSTGTLKILLVVAAFTVAALAGPVAARMGHTLSQIEATEPGPDGYCDDQRTAERTSVAEGMLL